MSRTLLYLGDDLEFTAAMELVRGRHKDLSILILNPKEKVLLSLCLRNTPEIIFLDLDHDFFIEEVGLLRSIPAFKSTLIIGLCKEEEKALNSEKALMAGVNLIQLQDNDADAIIEDSIQIAYEGIRSPGDFARAKDLSIPLNISFHACLSKVSKNNFFIESDMVIPSTTKLVLPMALDLPPMTMEVSSVFKGGLRENFIFSMKLNYPFPGPWDLPSSEQLDPMAVETWIDLKAQSFSPKKNCVAVFSKKTEDLVEIAQSENDLWFQFFSSVQDSEERLLLSHPGMIIYDLHLPEGTDLSQLSELITRIRDLSPSPIILVFGSPSDSKALQKLFNYEYILSNPNQFSVEIYKLMEEKFLAKKSTEEEEFYLSRLDQERVIHLDTPITLTSLTERDLTFLVDEEIPYFSTGKISLPIPALVTIIPAEGQLSAVRDKKHYRALIHGVEEVSLSKLRKIVNQLIFMPGESLTSENVEKMLKQDYINKDETSKSEDPGEVVSNQIEKDDSFAQKKDSPRGLRRKFKGISKL